MNANKASWTTHLRGAFEVGKWKIQLRGRRKERQRHEREKAEAVIALGARAWRHHDWRAGQGEAFVAVLGQLAELDQQQGVLGEQAEGLEASRVGRQAEKQRLEEHHGTRVGEAEALLKTWSEQLKAATSLRKEWDKTHKRLRSQETSTKKALAATQGRLQKAEVEPDAAAQVDGLRREISEAEQTLADLAAKLHETDQGIPQRIAEEAQHQQETDQQKERLDGERAERTRVLQPVEESLRQLGEQLATLEEQQAELAARKADALAPLGAQVNAARPASQALAEDYQRIDILDGDLTRTDLEISSLERAITASGPGARRVLYGLLAVVILAVVGAGFFAFRNYGFGFLGVSVKGDIAIRVSDTTGESIVGASTVLFFEGGPVAQYTDIHGAATLALDESQGRRGRLVVEAEGFRIHEQELRIESSLVEIRLEPPAPEMADVIVRSLDSSTHEPVAGAEVLVLANGDTFSQVTDSHGISKFTLAFYDAKAEVQMSVESKGYRIEHQRVTLLPDRVQDVNLDREAAKLAVAPFDIEEALVRNFRDVEENQLRPGTRATGALRAGTTAKYTFPGHHNTPVLFMARRTDGELSYNVLIYDKKDFLVAEHGRFGDGSHPIAFTPPDDGEYKLHLQGAYYGGTYAVTMAYLSGPPERRNLLGSLTQERSEKGTIAVGAFDDFEFRGEANKPLLLKVQRSGGELSYNVSIYGLEETLLEEHGRFGSGTQRIPFTPGKDGIYRVQIWGSYYFGSYTLAMNLLETGDREAVTALKLGQSHRGELAVSAYHDYKFRGNHNTPLLLTCQRSQGELSYGFEIYDAQNHRIAEHGRFGGSTVKVAFTPKENGEYRLRIHGIYNFGTYVLRMDLLGGPPETRDQVRPLAVDGSHTGRIGGGAYDDYSVAGRAGQPLVLTLQRQNGDLGYWVRIVDAEANEVANEGTFGGGIRQIPFAPTADGTFRVRVMANESFGSYVISLNEG